MLLIWLCSAILLLQATAGAQDTPSEQPPEHDHASGPREWSWTSDANVFAGYNYQRRKFTDVWAWESQNWFMLAGERAIGEGRLSLRGMASLEPFTLQA